MINFQRKSGKKSVIFLSHCTGLMFCSNRQATLRYRELNESLETVHKKLGDARVCGLIQFFCKVLFTSK